MMSNPYNRTIGTVCQTVEPGETALKSFARYPFVAALSLVALSLAVVPAALQAEEPAVTESTKPSASAPAEPKKTVVADSYYARRAEKQAELSYSAGTPEMDGYNGLGEITPTSAMVPHGMGQGYNVMPPEEAGFDYAAARQAMPGRPMMNVDYESGEVVNGGTVYGDGGMSNAGGGEYYGDGAMYGDMGCESCGDPSCDGYACTGRVCPDLWSQVHPGTTIWAAVDYLSWWGSDAYIPPLVTSSPVGTPQNLAGELGEPTTQILFGEEKIGGEQQSGGRIQARYWMVEGEFLALEGDFFMLEHSVTQFGVQSAFGGGASGGQILARPFFDALDDQWIASLIAFPNFVDEFGNVINLSGGVEVESRSEVQGAGGGGRHLMWVDFDHCKRLFVVGGYRFYRFVDRLGINDSVEPVGGFFAPGTRINTSDSFGVENEFHGGEIGLACEMRHNCFTIDVLGRVALGNNRQQVSIDGSTVVFDGTDSLYFNEGLLAQRSNIGVHNRDRFAIIPEVQVNLGYQINGNIKARVGYTMIYWFDTLRAGDQIDLQVNLNQGVQPQPAVPTVPFTTADWWLQGINAGLEVQF